MAWIDADENLTTGRYEGESLEEVAAEDSKYLFWMLEEADLTAEERSLVEKHLVGEGDEDEDEGSF